MSKKEIAEKFLEFMNKWNYEDFNAFEQHFNRLMSMKGKEQLTAENEVLKDSIAVVLAQKKNWAKSCEKKDQQIHELQEQLKNAIVPKFKKGQEVWFLFDAEENHRYTILNKKVMACSYNNYEGDYFEYAMSDDGTRDTIWYGYIHEKYIFATKEEAEQKLKELKEND